MHGATGTRKSTGCAMTVSSLIFFSVLTAAKDHSGLLDRPGYFSTNRCRMDPQLNFTPPATAQFGVSYKGWTANTWTIL
jgi:hypothetical protein